MNCYPKVWFGVPAVVALSLLLCLPALGQERADLSNQDMTTTDPGPQKTGGTDDDSWHFTIAPYLWFPGIHGTVGALGHDASIHVSGSDVLSYFNFGLMGAFQARKNRFVLPIDFMWVRLRDEKGIPENDLSQTSIKAHLTETFFTPKFGYRIVDTERWKIDALAGIRYWYLGQNFTFEPSGVGRSASANWVDGLGGAKIELDLSPKAAIWVLGDAGGGSANLDYQVAGLFGFKVKRNIALLFGWRYLDVDYRGNHQFIYDTAQSGPVLGATFELGGKPPAPPTASCSVQPSEVMVGEPLTATATASNFNPKHTLNYAWNSNGGKVTGKDTSATIDTNGIKGGSYAVTANINDPKIKKGGETSCTANFTVREPPKNPPTMSCSASPTSLQAGTSATITCTCTSPDDVSVTVGGWSSTGGNVSGSGSSADLNTSGTSPGTITVSASCTDLRGLTTAASTPVTIETPPPPKELEARLALHSIYFPTDMPKASKPSGGLVESQQKTLLTLASDFQKYLESRPDAKLILAGHADKRGAPDYNMALSQRRVDRTKSFLVEHGVPEANIETKALGEEENMTPDQVKGAIEANPDLNDEERQRILKNVSTIVLASNRRVDITLSTTGQESVRHFPFNAADSLTLIGGRTAEMKAAAAKKTPAKKP